MTIPDEAVEAAAEALNRSRGLNLGDQARAALEAAAPLLTAGHLETLAADVKARGDIGKDGGLEAWDYLTWKAYKLRDNT